LIDMKNFKLILKILNPFIFVINIISYTIHLEMYRYQKKYERYDFSKDIKMF